MQSKNQNGGVQLSTRYQQYDFAKRCLRGTPRPEVFPFGQGDKIPDNKNGGKQKRGRAVLSTKRTEYGKEIRKDYEMGKIKEQRKNMQKLEPRKDGVSNSLTSVQKDNLLLEDAKIRRLTPLECERLMGLPDGWTEGVSDTQRYKLCGNGVVVNVIKAIMKRILK